MGTGAWYVAKIPSCPSKMRELGTAAEPVPSRLGEQERKRGDVHLPPFKERATGCDSLPSPPEAHKVMLFPKKHSRLTGGRESIVVGNTQAQSAGWVLHLVIRVADCAPGGGCWAVNFKVCPAPHDSLLLGREVPPPKGFSLPKQHHQPDVTHQPGEPVLQIKMVSYHVTERHAAGQG